MARIRISVLVLMIPFFVSCFPEKLGDIKSYRLYYFVENKSEVPVVLELYRKTGLAESRDTSLWNEEHPLYWPLQEDDCCLMEGSVIKYCIQRIRATIESGFARSELFSQYVFYFTDHNVRDELLGWLTIYNLQDTSKYSFSVYEEGMPFVEHVWMQDTTDMRPRADYVSEFYITVTDSNLAAMQKDYSMLEKFPQYYGGQGK